MSDLFDKDLDAAPEAPPSPRTTRTRPCGIAISGSIWSTP